MANQMKQRFLDGWWRQVWLAWLRLALKGEAGRSPSAATPGRRATRCCEALCFFAICFAAALPAAAVTSVRDDAGNELRLAAPARRIVSLAPHLTESLFAAGAGERIVGTVEFSDFPEAARKIPRVGAYSQLDLERVAALAPDLIVVWESGNAGAQIERLRRLGFPVYVSEPNRLEDIASEVERLGILAGSAAPAAAKAAELRARLAALATRYQQANLGEAPVRTFFQFWAQPLMTVGQGQIINDVIALCGGVNVFADVAALAPSVSREAVIAANPEAIVVSGATDAAYAGWLDEWRRWPTLAAVRADNLFAIPAGLIMRHTPRLFDGSELLCRHLATARERRREGVRPAGGR